MAIIEYNRVFNKEKERKYGRVRRNRLCSHLEDSFNEARVEKVTVHYNGRHEPPSNNKKTRAVVGFILLLLIFF